MFKISLFIIAIALLGTSCASMKFVHERKAKNTETAKSSSVPLNACPNVQPSCGDIFPQYNAFISQIMSSASPAKSKFTDSIEMRESEIAHINTISLQKKVLNRAGNKIIIIWSSYYAEFEPDFTEIQKLYSNNKNDVYFICTDLGSDNQIKLMKKYYASKKFFTKSYFLYLKFDNIFNLKKELESRGQVNQFINDIIPKSENISFPYVILADKDQNVLFNGFTQNIKSDSIEYILANPSKYQKNVKLFQNYSPSKEDLELLAGNLGDKSSDNLSSSTSGISTDYQIDEEKIYGMSELVLNIPMNAEVVKDNRIYTLSIDSLKQMLTNDKRKKLVHFWGSWCPTTVYEMEEFAKLVPKNNEYSTYFISVDCNNTKQKDLQRAYYNKLNIDCVAYVINNPLNNQDEWMGKLQKVLVEYINVFDKDYADFAIPYTAVLDENNNVLYKKAWSGPKDPEEALLDKAVLLDKYVKNDFEEIKILLINDNK